MAAKFVVLFACVALAAAARLPRDAASPVEDLQKHADEFQKTIAQEWQALSSSKHNEEFHKALKDGSESVLQQLSALSNHLQAAAADASGKARQVLEQGQQQVQSAVNKLQNTHHDVHDDAEKLGASVANAISTAVQATQTLAKEVSSKVESSNDKLAPQIKSAYEDFVKNVQEVQKSLQAVGTKQ